MHTWRRSDLYVELSSEPGLGVSNFLYVYPSIDTTLASVSRGQSTPKHFPWWLDAFTTISAAILSLLLFYFRLLDMYLAAVQALVRRLPPEE